MNLAVAAVALTAWALLGSAGEIYREIVNNPHEVPPSLVGCPLLELLVLANRKLAVGRHLRGELSQPAELSVQFRAAEDKGRGSAVRTVMGIVDEMPLLQEAFHFLR